MEINSGNIIQTRSKIETDHPCVESADQSSIEFPPTAVEDVFTENSPEALTPPANASNGKLPDTSILSLVAPPASPPYTINPYSISLVSSCYLMKV